MSEGKVLRRLTIRSFHVSSIELGQATGLKEGTLMLNTDVLASIIESEPKIKAMTVTIIPPKRQVPEAHDVNINTIMDVVPISTKVIGALGDGVTHTLTGAVVVLTGCDESGKQMAEFGSSEGILSEQMKLGRAGTPGMDDYIILVDIILSYEKEADRSQPMAAFRACDTYLQTVREKLKRLDGRSASESHIFEDKVRKNAKKVLIIKQVAGQGAMYDNMLFPNEPSGYSGGRSIIDIGNVPVILSPNEYRDGALRAMT